MLAGSNAERLAGSPGGRVQLSVPSLPSSLQGKVTLLHRDKLQRTAVHASTIDRLHMVPALHLDGNEDVDVHDVDVMRARAQVRAPAL